MPENSFISRLWLRSSFMFDYVQYFFNGDFWPSLKRRFGRYLKDSVFDLACGTGELANYIHPQSYLGVDINQDYIDRAQKLHPQKNFSFLVGDITKLKDKTRYSTIAFIGASHHLSDSQIRQVSLSVSRLNPKIFLIVDGYPVGILAPLLRFLDDVLGGGKYFRDEEKLARLIRENFRIVHKGRFTARRSFYVYPYLVATAIRP